MNEDVAERLKTLGYEVTDADAVALAFAVESVTNTILNECNVDEIPDGLRQIAVDMACGFLLKPKLGAGQLTEIDVNRAIKTIKEGDTSITYAVSDSESAAAKFAALIDWLINRGKPEFITYRKFRW